MTRYVVTGATGYIGSMLIKHIMKTDGEAQITVLVRDKEKAVQMLPEGVKIVAADLTDADALAMLNFPCDYLIHCASVTKSAEMAARPMEVTESIVNATQNVLDLARRCHVKSMVYLSSMEVYGSINCGIDKRMTKGETAKRDEYGGYEASKAAACADGYETVREYHRVAEDEAARGVVDLLSARSCYPLAKRMAENICYSSYKEYGVPVKIARLAQTFGSGVLPADTRVFMQFARAAKEGKDIVLHTRGESVGNYCGIHDAVRGIMMILEQGIDGEAYNVVNEANTMTIREMAELVAEKIAGENIKVLYDIPSDHSYGYAPDTGLRLSGRKLGKLGWTPEQGMEDMYREVMECLG